MVTMREMLETYALLKDQRTVWDKLVDFLGQFCDDEIGAVMHGENGPVPEGVISAIRQRIMDQELEPLVTKIRDLEGSTVEVKDGKAKGRKQVRRQA